MELQFAPEAVGRAPESDGHGRGDREEGSARPGRVLVVDDDRMIRSMLGDVLRRAGYSVHLAEDGEAAWKALAASPYDLVITDHEMPQLRGLDLVRRLRESQFTRPIIMISGTVPREAQDLPALLSPGRVLEKPFRLQDLLAEVRLQLDSPQPASYR